MIGQALRIVLLLALALLTAPGLLAAAANNAAAHALLVEWPAFDPLQGPPQCPQPAPSGRAARYAGWALALSPSFERALANAGRAAWLAGDCAAAAAHWQRALALAPGDETTAFWLYWAAGGDVERPAGTLSAETLARHAYLCGEQARRAGLAEVAAAWYERSLALQPGRAAASQLARFHQAAERPEQAILVWQRVAGALPGEDAERWWAAAQAAELAKDWAAAAAAYAAGAARAEAPYEFWMGEGRAWRRERQWDAAEAAFRQALEARPDITGPYLELGHVEYARPDYGAARAWYEQAQALAPENSGVLYYLAQSSYKLGEIPEAVQMLARAVDLNSGQPWRWAVQLGDWRLELGDRQGALAAYRQALGWQPDEEMVQARIEQVTGQDD